MRSMYTAPRFVPSPVAPAATSTVPSGCSSTATDTPKKSLAVSVMPVVSSLSFVTSVLATLAQLSPPSSIR